MKTTRPFIPRVASVVAFLLSGILLFTGCVSNRYRAAPKDMAPPQLLNVSFAPQALEATLHSVITYNGPGSWKRDAFWDEYVISLRNPGSQPLNLSSLTLADLAGASLSPGHEPWRLEKESKTRERKYKDAGIAFVRYTAPTVLIVGAGAAAAASAGIFTAGATTAITATVVLLPVYYITVFAINQHNRSAMEMEFNRRQLVLPLTLAPGETRTGSFFFPMVPSPRSLNLHWSDGTTSGEIALPLDFLSGLHLKSPTAPAPREH